MAWNRSGDKPLSEPMVVSLLTHILGLNEIVNPVKPCNAYMCLWNRPPLAQRVVCSMPSRYLNQLEQQERLRSEDTPRRLMITHTIESCWIPSQNKVEWPWRYRSRSNVITCDTPSHANVHLYQIWKKNPSRTVDATERTRFSRSRPNDLENIGQGQRSLHVTHHLMLMMNCAKNGKNAF